MPRSGGLAGMPGRSARIRVIIFLHSLTAPLIGGAVLQETPLILGSEPSVFCRRCYDWLVL